jgi:hypothetical protein
MSTELLSNGRKSADLLHRHLVVWAIAGLIYGFASRSDSIGISLSVTSLSVPHAALSLLLLATMWTVPVLLAALLTNLRTVVDAIQKSPDSIALFTYPSLATATRRVRTFVGIVLSFLQAVFGMLAYKNALPAEPMYIDIVMLGGSGWFFATPMIYFAWRLANWDQGQRPCLRSPA